MPKRRAHHVLNRPCLAVGKLDLDPLGACWRMIWRLWWMGETPRRHGCIRLIFFRLCRLAIPFWIAEMMMRLHKIVDREIVLAIIEPRTTPDDLLELDHRVDGAHQHDVADVARIHSG